ncbi:putative krueppel c2h2-type zinc finger protein, partial [Danaus plexippus plexippus]
MLAHTTGQVKPRDIHCLAFESW